jgi:putative ABC transport system permease protein
LVVGIMKSTGKSFDSEIWAKRELVGRLFGKDTYTTMVLRAESASEAKRLVTYFGTEWGKAAVQPQQETVYFSNLNGTNQQFLVAIIIIAVIMSIGGVFGVMNTMFAAISQRIKDIGVMRVIGFGRGQILISFLLESMLLAVVGGTAGCLLGSLCDGWTANSIVGSGQGGGKSIVLRVTVDWQILMYGMLFSLIMGVIGGLLPALSAMRLKLLDLLR